MAASNREEITEEKLRERALWCRQLADGIADVAFAAILEKLISDEYKRAGLPQLTPRCALLGHIGPSESSLSK